MTSTTPVFRPSGRRADLFLRFRDGAVTHAAGRRLSAESSAFVLLEPSPNLALIPGDIVTAHPDHRGDLRVTGITALNGHATLEFRVSSTASCEDVAEMEHLLDIDELAFHDLPGGRCLFIWDEIVHLPLEETIGQLHILAAAGVSVTTQFQRGRKLQRLCDFRLPPAPIYPRVLNETIAELRRRSGQSRTLALTGGPIPINGTVPTPAGACTTGTATPDRRRDPAPAENYRGPTWSPSSAG